MFQLKSKGQEGFVSGKGREREFQMEGSLSSQPLLWGHTGLHNYIAGEVVQESVERTLTSSLIRTIGHIPYRLGQDTQLSKVDS